MTVRRSRSDAAHVHDAVLQKRGVLMGIAGTPVRVRNTEGKRVQVDNGPYMASTLPIAGFSVIEAADLDEAVRLVSQSPCAVAHGVIEVWPLEMPDAKG
jgi:hypothetical protein